MRESDSQAEGELVESARSFFLRFGYSRVSTGEIASSVGRSKKTLYKIFENKESLLLRVMGRLNHEAEEAVLQSVGDAARDAVLVLEEVLRHIAVNLISTQDVLFDDLRTKSPELYQQARSEREAALLDLLVPLVQRASADGHIRHDVDFHEVIRLYILTVEQLAQPLELASNDPGAKRQLDTFIRLLVDGLRYRSN